MRALAIALALLPLAVYPGRAADDAAADRADAAAARAEAAAQRSEAAAARAEGAIDRLERVLDELGRRDESRRRPGVRRQR
jgi:hypothetical protein